MNSLCSVFCTRDGSDHSRRANPALHDRWEGMQVDAANRHQGRVLHESHILRQTAQALRRGLHFLSVVGNTAPKAI